VAIKVPGLVNESVPTLPLADTDVGASYELANCIVFCALYHGEAPPGLFVPRAQIGSPASEESSAVPHSIMLQLGSEDATAHFLSVPGVGDVTSNLSGSVSPNWTIPPHALGIGTRRVQGGQSQGTPRQRNRTARSRLLRWRLRWASLEGYHDAVPIVMAAGALCGVLCSALSLAPLWGGFAVGALTAVAILGLGYAE
jgi:hypothetical protein